MAEPPERIFVTVPAAHRGSRPLPGNRPQTQLDRTRKKSDNSLLQHIGYSTGARSMHFSKFQTTLALCAVALGLLLFSGCDDLEARNKAEDATRQINGLKAQIDESKQRSGD